MSSPRKAFLIRFGAFCFLALQLGLIAWVVRGFEIQSQEHFLTIFCVAAAGFLVHWWLPSSWRLCFFNVLSLGTIAFVLGWPDAGWTLGIGAGLIILCTRPIRWIFRVIVLGAIGLLLASYRLEQINPFWPVLASMFMFRLIIYLFEVRRETAPSPLPLTVAYFMPLQNIAFLFFPILDFKTWRDSYCPDMDWSKAQIGIGYLVRGVTHLVAYRLVKYFLLPSPFELGDWPHLALFLAMNYALYLHVSGCFHIITGIFHLFGFAMPRTHDNYFLASSITDIWRRINIYWRDFMMKIFFFPLFFRLRGLGTRGAVALATLIVFAATWFLHVYQVFWMTRNIPFRLYDAGLWLGAGVIVVLNIQLELSRKRRPTTPASATRFVVSLHRAAGIAGTFMLVSLFWACWNTPQVLPSVRALIMTKGFAHGGMGMLMAEITAAIFGIAVLLNIHARLQLASIWPKHASPAQVASVCLPVLIIGTLLALPQAPEYLSPRPAGMLSALQRQSVLPIEAAQAVQGYYEDMAKVRAPGGAWLAQLEGKPYVAPINHYREMSRESDELLERELIPGYKGVVDGVNVSVNQFGMRDRLDRAQKKPAGNCRIALVGSSVVMGYGVNDDQTFARALEEDLNAGRNAKSRIELLNFGTGRSYVIQRQVLMDRKVFAFEPDAVYWFAHQDEYYGTVNHLAMLVDQRVKLPYGLDDIVEKAGAVPGTSRALVEALLRPRSKEIVACVYRHTVEECRKRGILPVWVYLPMPGVVELSIKSDDLIALARDAGFLILNMADWAEGFRPTEVNVGERDYHPNVLGNQIIAGKLAARLRADPVLLPACAR